MTSSVAERPAASVEVTTYECVPALEVFTVGDPVQLVMPPPPATSLQEYAGTGTA